MAAALVPPFTATHELYLGVVSRRYLLAGGTLPPIRAGFLACGAGIVRKLLRSGGKVTIDG